MSLSREGLPGTGWHWWQIYWGLGWGSKFILSAYLPTLAFFNTQIPLVFWARRGEASFFFFSFPFWALLHQLISHENLPKIVLPPGLATTKLWVPGLLAIDDLRPLVQRNWGLLDPAQLQLPYILRLSVFPSATLLS